MNPAPPLRPESVIGILGGGQLGRMLALAGARLGFRTHIFAPDDPCPAGDVAASRTHAQYHDAAALSAFARAVDVVTYEFENVPIETVAILENCGAVVRPGRRALETAQDRLVEKDFLNAQGARTAPYLPVDDAASLADALRCIGAPAILKTRRFGYDGKGQTRIDRNDADPEQTWEAAVALAWRDIGARPAILEGVVPFASEISIIGARSVEGAVGFFDAPINEHRGGILRRSVVPAPVSKTSLEQAQDIARRMLIALDYVGVIGVEFFVLGDGSVLANEFAPRVHNSGHWTLDACACSQFEQHIRAVAGWPLASTNRHSDATMENLIGAEIDRAMALSADPALCLHLYGKGAAREGRKMGHLTRLAPRTGSFAQI